MVGNNYDVDKNCLFIRPITKFEIIILKKELATLQVP